jgi:hypothetical protein
MRHACRLVLAFASALLFSPSAVQAADGIKASATATRDVPADIVVVSFHITERVALSDGISDSRLILARALEEKGLTILEKSARYQGIRAANAADPSSVILSAGSGRDPIVLRKHVAFRITGFRRIDDVLDVVGRHGLRTSVTLVADHSRADAVREELRKEAVERAIAQARTLASNAGVKTGGVVDLATQPGSAALIGTPVGHGQVVFLPDSTVSDQTLIDPPQPGELPRLRLSVTANIVLSIKSD